MKLGLVPPFHKHLWQGRFYDHIIRNEKEYMAIEQYIINNPANWVRDKLNGGEGNLVLEERAVYLEERAVYLEERAVYNEENWMV